jgi:hypothetical protein
MYEWQKREQIRLRQSLTAETYCKDGAVLWRSNDAVVPPSTFREAGLPVPPAQEAARDRYVEQSIGEYRAAMAQRTPEQIAEQRAEATAAMGRGVKMVNVLTGETFTT